MNDMENISKKLDKAFDQLAADEIDPTKADALANIAGKRIKLVLGQLSYFDQRKSTPVLPFWEPK